MKSLIIEKKDEFIKKPQTAAADLIHRLLQLNF